MTKTGAAKAEEGHVLDEYDLQPGEMTKEQVADKARVTLRAVEIWKKEGKLPARKVRRRITTSDTGKEVIKQVLIFMQDDVEKFLAEKDAAVEIPTIDRPSPETAIAARGNTDFQTAAMTYVVRKLSGEDEPPAFLTIDQATEIYGLSPAEWHRLVNNGDLRRFSGKNGRTMLSRRQIESL